MSKPTCLKIRQHNWKIKLNVIPNPFIGLRTFSISLTFEKIVVNCLNFELILQWKSKINKNAIKHAWRTFLCIDHKKQKKK